MELKFTDNFGHRVLAVNVASIGALERRLSTIHPSEHVAIRRDSLLHIVNELQDYREIYNPIGTSSKTDTTLIVNRDTL